VAAARAVCAPSQPKVELQQDSNGGLSLSPRNSAEEENVTNIAESLEGPIPAEGS